MCGIAGYIDFNKRTQADVITQMVKILHHRGPDDKGAEQYYEETAIIGLGQARLSIIDLSKSGHQPMHYNDNCIVFNGEIYNFKEIKQELEKMGHKFISNSDTEVILHGYEQWGTEFVHQLIGMFIIAIYDKRNRKVIFIRDRTGVKPIYYYWNDGLFIFASELKAFHIHSDFIKRIDKNALALYFDFGYFPAPYAVFENTYKIEPGKILTIDLNAKAISIDTYWNIEDYYCKPKFNFSYQDAKSQIRDLLISAFNYRMVADVPVGIFLSGGYDSAAVTAILQKDRTEKLKTFTIGFEEGNNEAPYSRETAKFLGTDHTEFICTTKEAQAIIPTLSFFYDEPFADSSAIPTMLVSQVARNHVTVALSADAGDEIFVGYTHYFRLYSYLNKLNRVPNSLKSSFQPLLNLFSDMVPMTTPVLKHKIKGFAKALNQDKLYQTAQLYRISSSLPEFYMRNLFLNVPLKNSTKYNGNFAAFANELEVLLAIDYQMYLQNDILTKVDRATMSVSLEGREPFLDHRLVEFAVQLPIEYKYDGITGKRILKEIVHEYIPKEMMLRPKAGFTLPIYSWLAGDLSYLIDDYLNEKAIEESGLFNTNFVMKQIKLFRENKFHYKPFIWKLLMFQMWYARWMK
jgi:asparagine synthase (glutamine-hydrolysing)